MKICIDEKLYNFASALPFPLYIVGGFVRDSLANLSGDSADIDLCAPVTTDKFIDEAVKYGAEIKSVYKNTGTVKFNLFGQSLEFASFRSDEYVRGVHRPTKTFFTEDISLDALRRDFKCNAVYFEIKSEKVCDPLGGVKDIEEKKISTVRGADRVFGEDGLRLLRLARQAGQTGFSPDEECLAGARENSALILDISAERVFSELNSILLADLRYNREDGQYIGLEIAEKTRVLDGILPELTLGRGMEQPREYHLYDVLEHSLRAVKYAHPSVRLAALLHDIGKPYCKLNFGNFHGHEKESARIAGEVLKRLKAPKAQTAEIVRLCETHMYDLRCDARESKIRKFLVNNYDISEKLMYLKQADFSACRDDISPSPCVIKWREILKRMKEEKVPFTVKELAVKGDELISAGVPAQKAGDILKLLLCDCTLEASLNSKQKLLPRALKYAEEV